MITAHERKKWLEHAKDPQTRAALEASLGLAPPAPPAPTKPDRPAIRLPKRREPNQGEREYGRILSAEFPGVRVAYEAITLNLPSGTKYTGDWAVFTAPLIIVEVKGTHRLGSAAASARAFKEAVAAFPEIQFRHATKMPETGNWNITHSLP